SLGERQRKQNCPHLLQNSDSPQERCVPQGQEKLANLSDRSRLIAVDKGSSFTSARL
ncbi:hypothetical protein LEMLEM_LOCUS992, partial [Lemmus lemmus]